MTQNVDQDNHHHYNESLLSNVNNYCHPFMFVYLFILFAFIIFFVFSFNKFVLIQLFCYWCCLIFFFYYYFVNSALRFFLLLLLLFFFNKSAHLLGNFITRNCLTFLLKFFIASFLFGHYRVLSNN